MILINYYLNQLQLRNKFPSHRLLININLIFSWFTRFNITPQPMLQMLKSYLLEQSPSVIDHVDHLVAPRSVPLVNILNSVPSAVKSFS